MRHAARVITGFPSFSPSLTDMLYGFSGRWMKCCLVSSDVNWHIRDKLWPVPKHGSKSVFTSMKTRRFVRTDSPGRPPRLSHSSWTMPFCELPMMMMSWCLMSSDVSWHIRDKLWPVPKHGSSVFTSTKTRRFVRTDSLGRPPWLSHSSWLAMPFCGLPMMMMSWWLMSSDVIGHIVRDKLWPMPKPAGFNNSLRPQKPEGSLGTDSPGQDWRPPRLSGTQLLNYGFCGR